MLRRIIQRLDQKERDWRNSFGRDITDPEERKRSEWHFNWLDHAILRRRWHNFEEVAPGVFRSNHPNHKRFAAYRDMGIKAVLNLRGAYEASPYLFEAESCEALGLTLIDVPFGARNAPRVESLLTLLDTFKTIERPFLMHCKSGADRTGLAAALYLLENEGADLTVAKKQLSFRFLHIKRTRTGILDHFIRAYEARLAVAHISLRDWITKEYDPVALQADFDAVQASWKPWQGWT